MKKTLHQKLSEKAAEVLVKELDEKVLEAVTGGGGIYTVPGRGCRACGIVATTGTSPDPDGDPAATRAASQRRLGP